MVPIGLSIMAFLVVVRLLTGGDRDAVRQRRAIDRQRQSAESNIDVSGLAYFVLPAVAADSRLADLSRAAGDLPGRRAVRRRRADRGGPDLPVQRARQLSAAGGAVLRAGRRDHGAGRHRAPGRGLGDVADRRRARLARGDDGRGLGAVRRDGAHRGRHGRGGRPDDLSVAPGQRLQRALLGRADRVVGRHRGGDPAVDRDDPLLGVGAAVGGRAVHRRHPAEPADRLRRRALCDDLRPHQDGAAHRARRAGTRSGPRPRRRAGRSAPSW